MESKFLWEDGKVDWEKVSDTDILNVVGMIAEKAMNNTNNPQIETSEQIVICDTDNML